VKSYGRAPTFLLLTGYEQARSVAAAIAGDLEAADDVQLVLPKPGSARPISCRTAVAAAARRRRKPAPAASADNVAKLAGKEGCGCGTAA